jgi:hypothetical protein
MAQLHLLMLTTTERQSLHYQLIRSISFDDTAVLTSRKRKIEDSPEENAREKDAIEDQEDTFKKSSNLLEEIQSLSLKLVSHLLIQSLI